MRMKSLKNRIENDKGNETSLNMVNKIQNYANEKKIEKSIKNNTN